MPQDYNPFAGRIRRSFLRETCRGRMGQLLNLAAALDVGNVGGVMDVDIVLVAFK